MKTSDPIRRAVNAEDPDWRVVAETTIWGKPYFWIEHTPTARLVLIGRTA